MRYLLALIIVFLVGCAEDDNNNDRRYIPNNGHPVTAPPHRGNRWPIFVGQCQWNPYYNCYGCWYRFSYGNQFVCRY